MKIAAKVSVWAIAGTLTLLAAPLYCFSAGTGQGKVIVSVADDQNQAFSGEWYLHSGTTSTGSLVRNGSSGESFNIDAGTYYLEVRGLVHTYPYYYVFSSNPQILAENDTITFNVQYFKTQDAMLTASGHPPVVQTPQTTSSSSTVDVYDEHGCNVTLGYAWCAKDQLCTKYWSPNCKVITTSTPAPTPAVSNTPEATPVAAANETAPTTGFDVPTFETPPVGSSSSAAAAPATAPENPETSTDAANGQHLVQTGSSATFLFIVSVLLAAGIVRLTYKCRT